jgi:hemerythrin superfamily protein
MDLPRIELSKIDIEPFARAAAELAAQGHAAAARGSDMAAKASGRVAREARAFAKREEAKIKAVSAFAASPVARLAGVAALGFIIGVAASAARKAAMQGAEARAGDWLAVLKAEHRAVEALVETALKTTARQKGRRTALLAKIKSALEKHELQEESAIYPSIQETEPEGMAKHLYSDHADLKILVGELELIPPGDDRWLERLQALQACLAHHVHEEEDAVFPRFHGQMSPQQNAHLTTEMHKEGERLA